jgi:signal transduction histidine kinase/DNA-binding NarL/FixJ family response regulator
MTGTELITNDLVACATFFKDSTGLGPTATVTVKRLLGQIDGHLQSIEDTNKFMLMAVNRCIDYTKSSNGLKLVPKYETINLLHTLKLPVQCMTNLQDRRTISLKGLRTEEICSHIITDKGWLQENLLCLLSNAVKYSSGGEIEIKVELINNIDKFHKVCSQVIQEIIVNSSCNEESSSAPLSPWRKSISFWKRSISHSSHTSSSQHPPTLLPLTISGSSNDFETEEEFLLFEIHDQGIGISDDAMTTLFNPFKQAQRLAGGTGLGLYSLAKRIEALKGFYGVHRREDGCQGSVFWFAIPYRPDASSSQLRGGNSSTRMSVRSTLSKDSVTEMVKPDSPVSRRTQHLTTTKAGYHVLLAEDSLMIAKMTSMMLKKQNHLPMVAQNGQIAVNFILDYYQSCLDSATANTTASYSSNNELHSFDVVLMDFQMPVMDGLEATRRIRAYEKQIFENCGKVFHQLIIGVSANSDYEAMEEARAAGIDEFLPKPFSMEAFFTIMKKYNS